MIVKNKLIQQLKENIKKFNEKIEENDTEYEKLS
jgi:hypothetical protein